MPGFFCATAVISRFFGVLSEKISKGYYLGAFFCIIDSGGLKMKDFTLKSIALQDVRVIRDPIHNYITIDNQVILDLIDTPQFQRLRRIKQLGGTSQAYPGGEHTRFSHSLGVYWIVVEMVSKSVIRNCISDYEFLCAMVAGLLHDLGHGPFSHSFEDIFGDNHELYTVRIIKECPQISRILDRISADMVEDVCRIIEKSHPNSILVSLVSSQLDADRMDYLLRDSYFTGVSYGQFDLARIIRCIRVKDNKLVYKHSGVQAIEDYILARYHMYWQVYFHPVGRSYEIILKSIFKRIKDLYSRNFDFGDIEYLLPFLNGTVTACDYTNLDEAVVLYYFHKFTTCDDAILSDLARRFLDRDLLGYIDIDSEDNAIVDNIKARQKIRGFDVDYYVGIDTQQAVLYHYYGDSHQIGEIEIVKNDRLVSFLEMSEIVGAIVNSKKNKEAHKIYFPK